MIVYYSIILSSIIIISNVGKLNSCATKRCHNVIDLPFICDVSPKGLEQVKEKT